MWVGVLICVWICVHIYCDFPRTTHTNGNSCLQHMTSLYPSNPVSQKEIGGGLWIYTTKQLVVGESTDIHRHTYAHTHTHTHTHSHVHTYNVAIVVYYRNWAKLNLSGCRQSPKGGHAHFHEFFPCLGFVKVLLWSHTDSVPLSLSHSTTQWRDHNCEKMATLSHYLLASIAKHMTP